jgi:hypothetical protein
LMTAIRRNVEAAPVIVCAESCGSSVISNVIGLCPEHHREAHYGARQEQLEREMIAPVEALCRLRNMERLLWLNSKGGPVEFAWPEMPRPTPRRSIQTLKSKRPVRKLA